MSNFLSDVGTGLLDSAEQSLTNYAVASAADSADLHPLLQAIGGDGITAPTPASGEVAPAKTANIPQTDGPTFMQRYGMALGVAAVVGLVVLLVVVKK